MDQPPPLNAQTMGRNRETNICPRCSTVDRRMRRHSESQIRIPTQSRRQHGPTEWLPIVVGKKVAQKDGAEFCLQSPMSIVRDSEIKNETAGGNRKSSENRPELANRSLATDNVCWVCIRKTKLGTAVVL